MDQVTVGGTFIVAGLLGVFIIFAHYLFAMGITDRAQDRPIVQPPMAERQIVRSHLLCIGGAAVITVVGIILAMSASGS